jgi:hypothetical protein
MLIRGKCQHCGRWIGTYQRKEETQIRACTHKADQGAGTFVDPIQFRACPGSGEPVAKEEL